MKILSLDSATEAASCAVIDENKLLGEITFNFSKQHSVVLMPMIDSLLKNLQMSLNDIDGFVVSKGPGSFTGLRIGMANIKGLSQGTNKPFVSVSSLDALAYNMAFTEGIVCPILDALRNNVYCALYTFRNYKLERVSDYMAISIDELVDMLKDYNDGSICFIGDGVAIHKQRLTGEFDDVCFAPAHLNLVRASSLGEIGQNLLESGMADNIYESSPIYLRKSQAEREYERKMGKGLNE